MSIYIARHGETVDSMTDRLSGPDAVLTALGEGQALAAAEDLAGKLAFDEIARIVASPRPRTMRTAAIIAAFFGIEELKIKQDDRLAERDLGSFIGMNRKEVFMLPEASLVVDGAEPTEAFRLRNADAYRAVTQEPGTTLFVTHSGNVPHLLEAAGLEEQSLAATQALLLHN